jgi:hypothetical protein
MTQQAATGQEYLIPDEIARAAVLPGSYTDEENTVFPAYAWLRANNPLGLAKVEGFDPIWLVTKHADLMAIGVLRCPRSGRAAGGAFTRRGCPAVDRNGPEFLRLLRHRDRGTPRPADRRPAAQGLRLAGRYRKRRVRHADLSVSAHGPRVLSGRGSEPQ